MSQGSANHRHPPGHVESWDEHAPTYARQADLVEPGLRAATEALLDAVQAGPGVRLLDLACGPGHTTAAAHARGADVLGVDLSAGMIEQARQRFPSVPFAVGDMAAPPPGPWDAIICRDGHHADPAWLLTALRALPGGGRIALGETEPTGPDEPGGKVSPAEWKRRLEAAGFAAISTRRVSVTSPDAEAHGTGGVHRAPMWIIAGRKP